MADDPRPWRPYHDRVDYLRERGKALSLQREAERAQAAMEDYRRFGDRPWLRDKDRGMEVSDNLEAARSELHAYLRDRPQLRELPQLAEAYREIDAPKRIAERAAESPARSAIEHRRQDVDPLDRDIVIAREQSAREALLEEEGPEISTKLVEDLEHAREEREALGIPDQEVTNSIEDRGIDDRSIDDDERGY